MSCFHDEEPPPIPKMADMAPMRSESKRRFFKTCLAWQMIRAGWSVPRTADALQIPIANLYRWADRYRERGLAGLDFKIRRKKKTLS